MRAKNPDTPEAREAEIKRRAAVVLAHVPGAHFVPTVGPDGAVRQGVWVPYGLGFEIPAAIDYEGGGPFNWSISIQVMPDGRPRCIDLRVGMGLAVVTPEELHRLPLGRLIEEAILMSSRPADEVPRKFMRWASVDEVRKERAKVASRLRSQRRGKGKARSMTEELLADVARVYRENVAGGKPSKAVAEHFNYTPESARRLVNEARKKGLLGPARPGRVGEHAKEEDNG